MPSKAELKRSRELLMTALFALNGIPNHPLRFFGYKDTYTLAHDISKFFKDVEDGAYRED